MTPRKSTWEIKENVVNDSEWFYKLDSKLIKNLKHIIHIVFSKTIGGSM